MTSCSMRRLMTWHIQNYSNRKDKTADGNYYINLVKKVPKGGHVDRSSALFWRRVRDSNPCELAALTVFKTAPL